MSDSTDQLNLFLAGRKAASDEERAASESGEAKPGKKPGKKRRAKGAKRLTAEEMGRQQREISVAEFFSKNRHLLGFDNPTKALLTTVKEAVDNSLDACEEAGILPEIRVEILPAENEKQNGNGNGDANGKPAPNKIERFTVSVEDNGPGVVKAQIPKIFGKLLYGSKFHRLRQSRGQQGIGISAAGMYGMLTTGQPVQIISRIGPKKPAHAFDLLIDTKKNAPEIVRDEYVDWDRDHGTMVAVTLEARFQRGSHSVEEFLGQCAVSNPHARFVYMGPDYEEKVYERGVDELPASPKEIKPHPHGVELGILMRMLKSTSAKKLKQFLVQDFSRVSDKVAKEICRISGLSETAWISRIAREEADSLYQAIPQVKIMNPPTNCLAPIGDEAIRAGLEKELQAEFVTTATRSPSVYRGNPFLVEVGIAYGGKLPADEPVKVIRFANRVPLLYQQSACAVTKAVAQTPWRNYGVSHPKGGMPVGPLVVFVHFSSVWVPFTSESKEAVAHYPEILKELKLALQEAGRGLGRHIRRVKRVKDAEKKRSYIEKYLPHLAIALQEILDLSDEEREDAFEKLVVILNRSRKI
ncbi:MAG: DNA topoisomerase VI subunit B [Planctomycetota bacterium]